MIPALLVTLTANSNTHSSTIHFLDCCFNNTHTFIYALRFKIAPSFIFISFIQRRNRHIRCITVRNLLLHYSELKDAKLYFTLHGSAKQKCEYKRIISHIDFVQSFCQMLYFCCEIAWNSY